MEKKPVVHMEYRTPTDSRERRKRLIAYAGTPHEQEFVFFERIEIGRFTEGRESPPGVLLLADPTISSQHCIITQMSDGRCFVRDVSRNGTRLDGKRLVPNVEIEFQIGQSINVGNGHQLTLAGESPAQKKPASVQDWFSTVSQPETSTVTVLVGDIKDYTVLVQKAELIAVQEAIRRVFHRLESAVIRRDGTVKEFRGDAIFAFWEKGQSDNQAVTACHAALELDALVDELARDPAVWDVPDFPLQMHWALATGPVTIATTGDDRPTGLSVIGRPVVLAFRLEKFADPETGSIVACATTRDQAADDFEFRDLGMKRSKGFDEKNRVFALDGPRRGRPDSKTGNRTE